MIKRPLAMSAVVFVLILFILSFRNDSVFRRNPVKNNESGEKHLACFLQDDTIKVYGVVSDYSYNEYYGRTTTELFLTDVHILVPISTNDNSNTNSYVNSNKEIYEYKDRFLKNHAWKKITRAGQKILLYINKEETLSIGETVLLSGSLSFFEPATNPGQFDAEKYYKNRDILFEVKKAVIENRTGTGGIRQSLKQFAYVQEEKLDFYLSDAYASILKAMLLGNKKELDKQTKDLYQNNGIAHILAISGLHISMLGMTVYRLLRRLPVKHWVALLGSEIFLLLYGCMVGFSASAFRAIVMFTFFLVSKISKRSYDMITAVAFTGMLQLMFHPGYLFDCGFQLSYGAILGMGILLPAFSELVKEIKIPWMQKGISIFLPALSVTLVTSPILIYHYHEISFFSILLNVIVIPLVSILLLAAIAMLALAEIYTPLAWICTIPVNFILGFYEWSCRLLELLPISQMNVAHPSITSLFGYYLLLFAMTVLVKKKRNKYQFLFPIIAAVLLLFPKKTDFAVWMLDVGQGDCSVIFTEEGNCFIMDCGSTSESAVGKKRLIPFLKYHGVGKVDAVFVSHADADHMNGVVELLECAEEENIKISYVVVHEQCEPEEWKQLAEAAKVAEVSIIQIGQGDCIQTKSVTLTCLYPLDGQYGCIGNASSMVLELEADMLGGFNETNLKCGKSKSMTESESVFKALFTGDMEKEGEEIFLREYASENVKSVKELNLIRSEQVGVQLEKTKVQAERCEKESKRYDVLKVGHHGSSSSSSLEFLRWATPGYAVISCGKDNSYGHPHEETLERLQEIGSTIVSTPDGGAVMITKDIKGTIKCTGWKIRHAYPDG